MILDIFIALYLIGCLIALGMILDDGQHNKVNRDSNYPKSVQVIGSFVIMLTSWVYVGYKVN